MFRRIISLGVASAAIVAVLGLPAAGGQPQHADTRSFPGPGQVVPGSATLQRQPDGISFTYHAEGLAPGEAHTIWFVAFNAPENCVNGMAGISTCGSGDLWLPQTEPTALWGAGHVVGGSGQVTFGGRIQVGDTSGCDGLARLPCGDGLTDPAGAEVHLVPRTHGPAIPGMVSAQIHSFNRGCETGEPNQGLCRNVQFAVFEV